MTRFATAQAELFAPDDVLPPPLQRLRDRLAAWTGVAPHEAVHALVSDYRPGTPLGWRRNAPMDAGGRAAA